MTAEGLVAFWQLASIILPLAAALAVASFLVWCVVGLVLWFSGRGRDRSVQPQTSPEWFESL